MRASRFRLSAHPVESLKSCRSYRAQLQGGMQVISVRVHVVGERTALDMYGLELSGQAPSHVGLAGSWLPDDEHHRAAMPERHVRQDLLHAASIEVQPAPSLAERPHYRRWVAVALSVGHYFFRDDRFQWPTSFPQRLEMSAEDLRRRRSVGLDGPIRTRLTMVNDGQRPRCGPCLKEMKAETLRSQAAWIAPITAPPFAVACAVADALGMSQILIHPHAGVLSAYGIGLADITAMRESAVDSPLNDQLAPKLQAVLRDKPITVEAVSVELIGESGITPDSLSSGRRQRRPAAYPLS